MKILGIDPSLRYTGIAVIEAVNNNYKYNIIDYYLIHRKDVKPAININKNQIIKVPDMYIGTDIFFNKYFKNNKINYVACEKLMFTKKMGYLIELYKLTGWIEHICYINKVPFVLVNPLTMKKYITGKGNANKELIIKSIKNRYNLNITGKSIEHITDAIGIALTSSVYKEVINE